MQANAEEMLHASFLPFTLGEHVCTIVFEDSACGKFVYEITGDTSLPAAFNKFKFQVSHITTLYTKHSIEVLSLYVAVSEH